MAWTIRVHEERPEWPEIGDMWPAPWLLGEHWQTIEMLSPRFARLEPKRDPYVVRLPGPVDFCIDTRAWSEGKHYGDGWEISGWGKTLTLTPSINIGGIYHGFITNGVITDDCEGRQY